MPKGLFKNVLFENKTEVDFLERKEAVEKQMEELNKVMETINYKMWYYETVIDAGTEAVHKQIQKHE